MVDIVGSRIIRSQWNETVKYYSDDIFLKYLSVKDCVSDYTYSEFNVLVKKTANFFLSLNIKQNELVALHLHNTPEYLICWLALAHIGAVSVPLNEHYQLNESRYILNKAQIHRIIVEPNTLHFYESNTEELKLDTIILTQGSSNVPGVYNLYECINSQPTELIEHRHITSDDTAVVLFTSGTTSTPKGAIYSQCAVLYGGILHAQQIGICQGDRFLTAMPCYHMDFQEMALSPVICMGATLIMVEHYSARKFWKQICDFKANFTDTMSVMNRTMLLQPIQPWEKKHSLKQIYFSMGLSDEEKLAFETRFNVRLLNSYGMTETVSAVTCTPLVGDQHWPSVGRPALSYNIKIIREDGTEASPNETGEICVHGVPGRTLISGYYNNNKATKSLLDEEGWLHSGDLGYLDKEGWLFFLGRRGDMVKRSGENVSALEVECILTSHPNIADAAVVGIPDPIRDQAVKAFILAKEGITLTEEEILNYCKTRLAKFKIPSVIEFVSDFPRTATGKIKKASLL